MIEGIHLIEEAYQSGIAIKQLFVIEPNRTDEALKDYAEETFEINMKVAESLSGTITPRLFAVIEKPKYDVKQAKQVLLIDRIQDPGNLGTLIRTSDAAGIDLIVMEKVQPIHIKTRFYEQVKVVYFIFRLLPQI